MAMSLTVVRAPNQQARDASLFSTGVLSAQFGDDIVLCGADHQAVTEAAASRTAHARVREVDADATDLYVVIQNGRLFQQHHPEIPVLHDRGRVLLVALPAAAKAALANDLDPCYTARPLVPGEIVFSTVRAQRQAQDVHVRRLVDSLSREHYETSLRDIVVSAPTRHSASAHFRAVSDRAAQALAALGYTVERQSFSAGAFESLNVIASRNGNGAAPRGVVIVTAHLDSINLNEGPTAPAPGADDNASGSAGVLEIARVFATHVCAHDLRFILFGGEEQGLHGSQHYVAALPSDERGRVKAIVNMDMIGRLNKPRATVLIEGAGVSRRIIDTLAQAAATYTTLAVETSLNAAASDHVPFIKAGLPAVLTIEGADSTNGAVHSARDVLDTIDYALALEILRMNVAFVADALGCPSEQPSLPG